MTRPTIRVLLVEDSPSDAHLIQQMIAQTAGDSFLLQHTKRLAHTLPHLAEGNIDLVLLDLTLPDSWGPDTFATVQVKAPHLPIIILTGFDDERMAIDTVRSGAQDYLIKGQFDGRLLVRAMRYAIERKQSQELLHQRTRELELLNNASHAFSSTLDIDTVLTRVLDETRKLLGVVAASVWLLDSQTGELVCQQATGTRNEVVRGWRLEPGQGIAGWTAVHGEGVIVPDARADSRHFFGVSVRTGLALCSVLSLPLKGRRGILGVLQVVDTQPNRFDASHLALLEPLALSAGMALENAQLYQQAQFEIAEREFAEEALVWEAGVNWVLAELGRTLITTTSLDKISYLILERARRLTSSAFGYAAYIDAQTGHLVSPTLTRDIWDACQVPDKSIVFAQFKGLWGWSLNNHQPLLTNDSANDPRSTGTPTGHLPIERFLAVPAMLGSELVGQIALANADRDYTPRDQALVERLAALYALAVQRQRSEQALHSSEVRFRSTFEQAAVGIVHTSPEGQFIRVNHRFCEIVGHTQEELLNLNFQDITYTDDLRADLKKMLLLLSDQIETYSHEKRYIRADQSIVWANLTVSLVRDDAGEPLYFISVVEDISTRKQAEQALRESEHFVRTIISSVGEGIIVYDRDMRYQLWNPFMEQLSGMSADEVLGRPAFEIFPHLREQGVDQLLARTLAGETVRSPDTPYYVPATGKNGWVVGLYTPHVSVDGQIIGVVASVRDITHRKRAEDALRQLTQQIVTAQEEERRRISRELHDEAGQALTALKIGLQLISLDLPPNSETLAERIDEAVALTDTTMEQIRMLAQDLRPPALDTVGLSPALSGLCRDLSTRTQLPIHYTGLETGALPEATSICLYRFLQEALTNVVRHASAGEVHVILQQDAETINLTVQDDGQGFDPQTVLSSADRSLGIGLLGMRERVELLGGRLEIDSRPGGGTRLVASIPRSEEE